MSDARSGLIRKSLALTMLALSGYYIYAVLAGNVEGLREATSPLGAIAWAALFAGCLGTQLLGTAYHVYQLKRLEHLPVNAGRIALAYALGQLVRYLPGKIVGVVFQAGFLKGEARPGNVVLALMTQTAFDYGWTIALSGTIVAAYYFQNNVVFVLLPLVLLAVWAMHAWYITERFVLWLPFVRGRLIPDFLRRGPDQSQAVLLTVLIALAWLPLLLGLKAALDPLIGEKFMLMAALYLFASILSLLVVVVPSGLFVREALFTYLGTLYGIDPASLVLVGLYVRIALTASEIGNALLLSLCRWPDRF